MFLLNWDSESTLVIVAWGSIAICGGKSLRDINTLVMLMVVNEGLTVLLICSLKNLLPCPFFSAFFGVSFVNHYMGEMRILKVNWWPEVGHQYCRQGGNQSVCEGWAFSLKEGVPHSPLWNSRPAWKKLSKKLLNEWILQTTSHIILHILTFVRWPEGNLNDNPLVRPAETVH